MRRWKRIPEDRRNAGGLLASFCVIAVGLFGALVVSMAGGQVQRALALPLALFLGIAFLPLALLWGRPRRDLFMSPQDSLWSRLRDWVRGREDSPPLRPWKRKRLPPRDFDAGSVFSPAREVGSDVA